MILKKAGHFSDPLKWSNDGCNHENQLASHKYAGILLYVGKDIVPIHIDDVESDQTYTYRVRLYLQHVNMRSQKIHFRTVSPFLLTANGRYHNSIGYLKVTWRIDKIAKDIFRILSLRSDRCLQIYFPRWGFVT